MLASEDPSHDQYQRQLLADAVRELNAELIEVVTDTRFDSAAERPGLMRAVRMVSDGAADGIVVASSAHLTTRIEELAALVCSDVDCEWVFASEGLDISSPLGEAWAEWLELYAAEAELGVSNRRAHRMAGIRRGGNAPYGFISVDSDLIPHVKEQGAISRILELYEGGISLRKIAETIATEGHPPRGSGWHATSVRRIVLRHGTTT
jgi:DNA invertase Pin-like site-specific DNA recombinase